MLENYNKAVVFGLLALLLVLQSVRHFMHQAATDESASTEAFRALSVPSDVCRLRSFIRRRYFSNQSSCDRLYLESTRANQAGYGAALSLSTEFFVSAIVDDRVPVTAVRGVTGANAYEARSVPLCSDGFLFGCSLAPVATRCMARARASHARNGGVVAADAALEASLASPALRGGERRLRRLYAAARLTHDTYSAVWLARQVAALVVQPSRATLRVVRALERAANLSFAARDDRTLFCMHVRRGDKGAEFPLHPLKTFAYVLRKLSVHRRAAALLLMSDDADAVRYLTRDAAARAKHEQRAPLRVHELPHRGGLAPLAVNAANVSAHSALVAHARHLEHVAARDNVTQGQLMLGTMLVLARQCHTIVASQSSNIGRWLLHFQLERKRTPCEGEQRPRWLLDTPLDIDDDAPLFYDVDHEFIEPLLDPKAEVRFKMRRIFGDIVQ